MIKWDELNDKEKLAIKLACESSFEMFIRIFFQLVQGQKLLFNWHHKLECKIVEQIISGDLKRVVINVAPGSTKTEIWSIHFIAWGIIKCIVNNKSSRWLPISYSDDLVTENAGRVKDILTSDAFQECWNLSLSKDTKAKGDWKFIDSKGNMHRLYGVSTSGQVTGRRAGFMVDGFSGALVLDDPLPPKNDGSPKIIDKANKSINRVVRSRLAHDDVPIICIQQRICKGDTTDFLMNGKTADTYTQIKIPSILDGEYINNIDDEEIKKLCIQDTGFNGEKVSYWQDKEPLQTLLNMEKADGYMFSSQYQQEPNDALLEGLIYKKEIDLMIAENRYCAIPIEPSLPTFTFWDLGINDDMVIWVMQVHQKELRLVACYGNNNESMEHYINWLKDFQDKYNVRFQKHYAPHDIAVRDLMTGKSRIDIAKMMGIVFNLVARALTKQSSIDALKTIFPRMWIDKNRCEKGWQAIKILHREFDVTTETFKDQIVPKWATNYTDALQQMGLFYKEDNKRNDNERPRRSNNNSSSGWMGA